MTEMNPPCLPCQQRVRLGALGVDEGASTGPSFDMKRDILAGVLAFGAPIAYDHFAPKKWPHPNLWQQAVAVVGVYLAVVWLYEKV